MFCCGSTQLAGCSLLWEGGALPKGLGLSRLEVTGYRNQRGFVAIEGHMGEVRCYWVSELRRPGEAVLGARCGGAGDLTQEEWASTDGRDSVFLAEQLVSKWLVNMY